MYEALAVIGHIRETTLFLYFQLFFYRKNYLKLKFKVRRIIFHNYLFPLKLFQFLLIEKKVKFKQKTATKDMHWGFQKCIDFCYEISPQTFN